MHAMALLTAEVAGVLALGTRALSRHHKAEQARGRHRLKSWFEGFGEVTSHG